MWRVRSIAWVVVNEGQLMKRYHEFDLACRFGG